MKNTFVHVKVSLQLLPLLLNAYTHTLAQAHAPPHDPSVPPPLPPRPGPGHALYRYVVSAHCSVYMHRTISLTTQHLSLTTVMYTINRFKEYCIVIRLPP